MGLLQVDLQNFPLQVFLRALEDTGNRSDVDVNRVAVVVNKGFVRNFGDDVRFADHAFEKQPKLAPLLVADVIDDQANVAVWRLDDFGDDFVLQLVVVFDFLKQIGQTVLVNVGDLV